MVTEEDGTFSLDAPWVWFNGHLSSKILHIRPWLLSAAKTMAAFGVANPVFLYLETASFFLVDFMMRDNGL